MTTHVPGTLLSTGGMAAAVTLLLLVVPEPAVPDPDRAASAGMWRVVTVEVSGRPVDADIAAMLTVVYAADGRWRVLFKSIAVAEGTSRNDPATTPKSFVMQTNGPPDGSRPGDRYLGIYELRGDTRRFCFVSEDLPRPGDFTSSRGSGRILVTLERAAAADRGGGLSLHGDARAVHAGNEDQRPRPAPRGMSRPEVDRDVAAGN